VNEELKKSLLHDFYPYPYSIGKGWHKLIDEFLEEVYKIIEKESLQNRFFIFDIKEKYGALIISVVGGIDEIFDLIDKVEEKSLRTCEICGKAGELKNLKCWHRVRCEKCIKE
jgi:hypothetical protein